MIDARVLVKDKYIVSHLPATDCQKLYLFHYLSYLLRTRATCLNRLISATPQQDYDRLLQGLSVTFEPTEQAVRKTISLNLDTSPSPTLESRSFVELENYLHLNQLPFKQT